MLRNVLITHEGIFNIQLNNIFKHFSNNKVKLYSHIKKNTNNYNEFRHTKLQTNKLLTRVPFFSRCVLQLMIVYLLFF